MSQSTIVVVPACNEAARIGAVLDQARDCLPTATVLVVDDGSADETGTVATAHGAKVVRHPFNLGYGAALQTGYHYARRHGFDRVVQLDADGQHDPASIPSLIDALDRGADVCVGSRYLTDDPPATSLLRRVGTRIFAWLVTAWTGRRITDPTSGFQALGPRALDLLTLDHFPEDYPDADVLITVSRAGLELTEVPVRMYERIGGVSMHRGTRVAWYGYKMLVTLALLPIRRTSPLRSGRELHAARNRA